VNVLWFVADALRRDYAFKMPYLQKWGKGAVRLDQHFAMSHCSDPNFLSLLTGAPPWVHQVYTQLEVKRNGINIQYEDYRGLQHELRKRFGHRSLMMGPTLPTIYLRGIDVVVPLGKDDHTFPGTRGLKQFMDEQQPWFAFVRTMDCHVPYYGGHYRRAVRYTDEIIFELFNWVEAHHPDTQIWFFSDHGEGLGEHGEQTHLSTLYDVLLRTPMYVKFPGCKAGLVVEEHTQHVDVPLTVLSLCGDGSHFGMGRDLAPLLRGGRVAEKLPVMWFAGDGAFREKFWNWRAVRDDCYKYMVAVHIAEGPIFHLYDIRQDPKERVNLANDPQHAQTLQRYAGMLAEQFEDWPRPGQENWTPPMSEAEAEILLERLKALGYA